MAKIPSKPFILIDGSSYLFRAYHAMPPLTNSKGEPTGAIFGVVNMIRKLRHAYETQQMAVVFDSKEKNFRHALYEPYKANRVKMPEELQQQIAPLHQLIRAMGLPLVMIPGIEADDIIGTLARKAQSKGLFTLISTGDKDFAQLVDEKTFLINTMTGDIFDREKILEKFEVPPEQIVDYLALMGDTVDNIPGVPKVGPKTAIKWLQTYGNLTEIIAKATDITGKVGENLRMSLEQLPLFKELVTIQTELDLDAFVPDLTVGEPSIPELQRLYAELEFKAWLKEITSSDPLKKPEPETPVLPTAHYETVLESHRFLAWLERLKEAKRFSFDVETTSLDYMKAEIVGVSFSISPGEAAYVPLAHDYLGAPLQLERDWALSKLKPLLEDPTLLKIGHNLKYDLEVLANYQINLNGLAFDTMLASYVFNSTGSLHNMDTLAERYLHYRTTTFEEVAGKGAKQVTFNQVELEKAGFYAAEDADVTLKLEAFLKPLLEKEPSQKFVFETLEMPLVPVLAQMERRGVLIDSALLNQQSQELGEQLTTLEEEAYKLAGRPFNINSPKQLQEILYTDLKLPILEKTPTGQPSTAESVMQELALEYPLPQIILDYRSLSKLKSTYTDRLPLQINPQTGRVHTSYHQAVTATGRLSSSDPNLQNIPIRTKEGRKIRSAFITASGYKIVAADYSQIELRIMAHLSEDENLLKAFSMGGDIHQSTAAMVFGVAIEAVTAEQRRKAKAINFGLMYGMSMFGLAKQLGISREEAQAYIGHYFKSFPGVKRYMDETRARVLESGFVETLFGRRLYLPEIKSSNVGSRRAAERAAINAPMQGTNADMIKLSMIKIDEWIRDKNLDISMIMQVHDELVFEIAEPLLNEAIPHIQFLMETICALSVPLKVGIGVGQNWDEAHSI